MNLSFVATQLALPDFATALDLARLSEEQEMPNTGNWLGFQVKTGWSIFSTSQPKIIDRFIAEDIASFRPDCLVAHVNDTVMWSKTELYQSGQLHWSIEHSGEEGKTRHLITKGAVPAQLAEIRDRNFAEQD